jgi:hypothetical protein
MTSLSINTGENTPEFQAAPEGHDEKMIAVAEGRAGETEKTEEKARPSWLPEKFKTEEDFAKAYAELERKVHTPKAEDGAKAKAEDPTDLSIEPPNAEQETAEQIVEDAGLDYNAMADEYWQGGDLTPETYTKLAKAGISKDMVQDYIDGQQARGQLIRQSVLGEIGGEDNFRAMSQWASVNLSAPELTAYNKLAESRDPEVAKMAVSNLYSKYTNANGRPAQRSVTAGKASGGNPGEVFRSTAELTRAMSDPRYKTDPAYRQDIADRLRRSEIM